MPTMQLKKFSPGAQKVLLQCRTIAQKNHNLLVEPEHLAMALLTTIELKELLKKKNVEHKALEKALLQLLSNLPRGETEPQFSKRLIHALSSADALSVSKGHENIYTSDIFLALVENKDKYGALSVILSKYFLDTDDKNYYYNDKNNASNSLLFSVADSVNSLIKNNQNDPIIGRDDEIERIIQVLSRKNRNNPLLIGEPGVGKSSIVYGLTKRIIEQNIPSHLITKEIIQLDLGALVSGTTLRGQFEERIKKILLELEEQRGHYILFIRDLSLLMGAGGEGVSDAANLFKPSLAKGSIQVIGLVTPEDYKKRVETDASFARYFQPIWIFEPSTKESIEILRGLKDKYERFHGVFIEDDALISAVELGARHMTGQVLPELALTLIDEASSKKRIIIDEKPTKLKNLANKLSKGEMDLYERKTKSDAKDGVKKLKELYKKTQDSYEKELAIIESMRALKSELLDLNARILREKTSGSFKTAADLVMVNKKALENEFLMRQTELKRIKKTERFIDPFVKREDIAAIISQETGIPANKMLQSEREKLKSMEVLLGAHVIGQNEAVSAVSNAIRRARVGLRDAKRPIGSFLFLGPTGVGKTELARTLTNFLFDDERAMVRFDMSEFMERHSVARLIGSPPGYQGSDEGGELTEKVRRKPYSVVLFDEIEKAHVDVLNVLLQVLDEGRLTDSKGHLVHFANTVVIMTSNVGSDILLTHVEQMSNVSLKQQIMQRLLNYLRPELINRIDEIIIFKPLDQKSAKGIVELSLETVIKRLSNEGYHLMIDAPVKERLLEEGYSREFGARPLKRAIQRLIENPLAMVLIKEDFKKGDTINAYLSENEILFRRA